MNPQFFRNTDLDKGVARPAARTGRLRRAPPTAALGTEKAKVAINIVVNYEEGSEKTFAMGDGMNDGMYELPFAVDDQRELAVESMYEYGTRAGIWRMLRVYDTAGIPVTIFGVAVAFERNPGVAAKGEEARRRRVRARLSLEQPLRDEPRRGARGAIKRAIASIEKSTGARPLGLVLPRDEHQHPRAGGRGGRLPLRFRHLQRRPAVLGPRCMARLIWSCRIRW